MKPTLNSDVFVMEISRAFFRYSKKAAKKQQKVFVRAGNFDRLFICLDWLFDDLYPVARYLCVWGRERNRLRRTRGLMGRDEGKISF